MSNESQNRSEQFGFASRCTNPAEFDSASIYQRFPRMRKESIALISGEEATLLRFPHDADSQVCTSQRDLINLRYGGE